MAGLLTHLGISLALFIVTSLIFRKSIYGISVAIGQLIPDAIKFGITGIKLKTLSPTVIISDDLFWELEFLMNDYHTWVILGIIVVLSSFFLYYFRKIKKQKAKEINWNYLIFVIGVIIHLIIDLLIIETSYWI